MLNQRQYYSRPKFRAINHHESHNEAPFPMCFTQSAIDSFLDTVGCYRPETGAKGFGPMDFMGFDLIEFDRRGSLHASGAVYAPDVEWGEARRLFWLNQPDSTRIRIWTGDLHSHPGGLGRPSGKSGRALGDLGYVEAIFDHNEWMQYFFIPILTFDQRNEQVAIHPWIVERQAPHRPMCAQLEICDVADFPKRLFNPDWELEVGKQQAAPEVSSNDKSDGFPLDKRPPVDVALLEKLVRGAIDAVHQDDKWKIALSIGGMIIVLVLSRNFPKARPQVMVKDEHGSFNQLLFNWKSSTAGESTIQPADGQQFSSITGESRTSVDNGFSRSSQQVGSGTDRSYVSQTPGRVADDRLALQSPADRESISTISGELSGMGLEQRLARLCTDVASWMQREF